MEKTSRVQSRISSLINFLEVDNSPETPCTREPFETDSWFLQLFTSKLWSTLSAIVRVGQRENTTHTHIPTTSGMAWAVIHQMGLGQGGLKFIQHFWEKHTLFSPLKERFKCCKGRRKKWRREKEISTGEFNFLQKLSVSFNELHSQFFFFLFLLHAD